MSEVHFNKEKGSQLKLFTPGPVYVPERILKEMAKPNDTHRSKPFLVLLLQIQSFPKENIKRNG